MNKFCVFMAVMIIMTGLSISTIAIVIMSLELDNIRSNGIYLNATITGQQEVHWNKCVSKDCGDVIPMHKCFVTMNIINNSYTLSTAECFVNTTSIKVWYCPALMFETVVEWKPKYDALVMLLIPFCIMPATCLCSMMCCHIAETKKRPA